MGVSFWHPEIAEKIHTRQTAQKFKPTKLQADKEIYKEAHNTVEHLIRKKKKAYFEEKTQQILKNFGKH